MTTAGEQDAIPLTEPSIYSRGGSASTSGHNGIKQQRGEFAAGGVQPSFALELDISTIEHVSKTITMLCLEVSIKKISFVYVGLVW